MCGASGGDDFQEWTSPQKVSEQSPWAAVGLSWPPVFASGSFNLSMAALQEASGLFAYGLQPAGSDGHKVC